VRHLFSPEDVPFITAYAHSHLGSEVQELISSADKILANRFPLVSGEEFSFPDAIPWQGPFPDQEQMFYLNRWYHGVTLAKAFAYTGSEKYISKFVELLEQWSSSNPAGRTGPVWESYSVGERMVSWLFAHFLLQRSSTYRKDGERLLVSQLAEHAKYLAAHPEVRVIHNHLINNARALFQYGVLCPDLPQASEIRDQAWKILVNELNQQFRDDGMLGEQSSHYHLLLCSRYTEIILLARRNGYSVSEDILVKLRNMYSVSNLFVRPDHTPVLIGDTSPDITPQSAVGILAVGAALFNVPSTVPPNEYAIWFLGRGGLEGWYPGVPNTMLCHLPDSGFAVYKTPQSHLVMHCDPIAEVVRHGHQDILGIDWWANGEQVLSDSGNSSFSGDTWHQYFRGPRAHSTLILDGLRPFIVNPTIKRLFRKPYPEAGAHFTKVAKDSEEVVIQAEHSGYHRLPGGLSVSRRVRILPDGSLSLHDHLDGRGRHHAELLFQFGCNHVKPAADGRSLEVCSPTDRPLASVAFNVPTQFTLKVRDSQLHPQLDGWYAPQYGSRHGATSVACEFQTTGPMDVETLFRLKSNVEASPCAE
jgi:hypothetical protein